MTASGLPLSSGKDARQIGIRIPNVPQDVPVANESPTAIRNTIAGRKFCSAPAELETIAAT